MERTFNKWEKRNLGQRSSRSDLFIEELLTLVGKVAIEGHIFDGLELSHGEIIKLIFQLVYWWISKAFDSRSVRCELFASFS